MTALSFYLRHTNVEQPDPTAARHATIHATAALADVFTLNECGKDHAYVKALSGFSDLTVGENSIGWRPEKFTRVDAGSRKVMRGGRLGRPGQRARRRRDRRRRGPNRYVLWVVLREKATGRDVIVATHHAIAKADTAHKWRRGLRRQGFRAVGRELLRAMRRNPSAALLITGDLNTKGAVNFAGPSEVEVPTPKTYGRLRYDRLFKAGPVSVGKVGTFKTHSDHKGLRATITLLDPGT